MEAKAGEVHIARRLSSAQVQENLIQPPHMSRINTAGVRVDVERAERPAPNSTNHGAGLLDASRHLFPGLPGEKGNHTATDSSSGHSCGL